MIYYACKHGHFISNSGRRDWKSQSTTSPDLDVKEILRKVNIMARSCEENLAVIAAVAKKYDPDGFSIKSSWIF